MLRFACNFLPFIFIFSCTVGFGSTASTNFTIDDDNGDQNTGLRPAYSPLLGWKRGNGCSGCTAKLDASKTFMRTWHEVNYLPTDPEPRIITLRFNGTAIYTYFVLPNARPPNLTEAFPHTVFSFVLDGSIVGSFQHEPRLNTSFEYNFPVYSNMSIPDGQHQLQIIAESTTSILVLFDYAVYTFDPDVQDATTPDGVIDGSNENTSSGSGTRIPVIVGAIVGGVSVACFLGVAVVLLWRRQRFQKRNAKGARHRLREDRTHEPLDECSVLPPHIYENTVYLGGITNIPRQNYVSSDSRYGSTSRESTPAASLLSLPVSPPSNPTETQPNAHLSRKELERRRAMLESRMQQIQGRAPGTDEIRPDDSASRADGATIVTSSDNPEVRMMIGRLRTEVELLSAQLQEHRNQDQAPPAY